MANPNSPGPKIEVVSDLAAAEREVEAYLARVAQAGNQPEAQLPFALDPQGAAGAFTTWLNGLALVPGDLKTSAELGPLKPIYVPFWSVHSQAYTTYAGERGEEYKDTEYFTDASGASQSREVTKLGWTPAHGEVRKHFEGLLLCGASGLPDEHVKLLSPRDIKNHQPYRPDGNGATVQRSALDVRTAFNKARGLMEADLRALAEKDIGGKQQKVTKLETRHIGVSVKQILVPAYEGAFRYGGKEYRVLINGVTGEVAGDHPVSAGKVALVVAIVLAVFVAICAALWFFLIGPQLKKTSLAPPPEQPAFAWVASDQQEVAWGCGIRNDGNDPSA